MSELQTPMNQMILLFPLPTSLYETLIHTLRSLPKKKKPNTTRKATACTLETKAIGKINAQISLRNQPITLASLLAINCHVLVPQKSQNHTLNHQGLKNSLPYLTFGPSLSKTLTPPIPTLIMLTQGISD